MPYLTTEEMQLTVGNHHSLSRGDDVYLVLLHGHFAFCL